MKKGKKLLSAFTALIMTVPACTAFSASAEQVDEYWLWQKFIDNGLSEAGTAGVLGNLKAESDLLSENLQDSYEDYLGYDDWSYVNAVDWGWYDNFVYDDAGFGLPQFTFPARKQNFLNSARYHGLSIANAELQVNFIMEELRNDYPGVLNVLRTTGNVYEATKKFMCDYENPADQSDSAIDFRYDYAYSYYADYAQGLAISYTPVETYEPSYSSYSSNIGDTVMFNGTNHHISAWDDSYGSYCGSGLVQITDVCPGSPYSLHAVAVSGSGSNCHGWISPSEISYDTSSAVTVNEPEYSYVPEYTAPEPVQSGSINVGDVMMFNGTAHHLSAFDTSGGSYCTPGLVQITDIYYNGTYQYHAVGTDGSSCWGWVSANDLSPVGSQTVSTPVYEPAPVVQQNTNIQVGSTVYFYGGGHYAWCGADSPTDYPPAGTAVVTNIVEGSAHPYHIVHTDGSSWVYGYCDASSFELLY